MKKSSAEVVCTSCGFVITAKLPDRGPEWRAFNPEQQAKKVRVWTSRRETCVCFNDMWKKGIQYVA